MSFNLKSFLLAFISIAPSLISGVMGITHEVGAPGVSNLQVASDSLHLATGVTAALASSDPSVVADAQAASSVIQSTIDTIGQVTAKSGS